MRLLLPLGQCAEKGNREKGKNPQSAHLSLPLSLSLPFLLSNSTSMPFFHPIPEHKLNEPPS